MTLSDQHARDLISTSGLGQTLFVEAGAGTGKTTQLVGRIVTTVMEQRARLAEIAAITFTEAAASELQARIRVEFERKAASDDPTTRERALEAIADADLAAISTVHGFASRILSEFSVLAKLPPRVSVLDEVASQLATEQRWERFVDWLDEESTYESLMYRAAVLNIALTPRYRGQGSLKDVAANLAQNWDRLEGLASRTVADDLPPIDYRPFDAAVAALVGVEATCSDPGDRLVVKLADWIPEMQRAVSIDDESRKLRHLAKLRPTGKERRKWKPGVGKKGNWDDIETVRGLVESVNEALVDVVDSVTDDVLDRLLTLTAREVYQAARERQRNGGLEFHDLLVLARQVLRDEPEVRRALHDRYRHVLLDEFQDTDPIQIELASLIAATPAAEQPADWQDHTVEGGRLFFVGDPKQSIYRFRRADIELFLEARDAYGGAASGPVRLDTNFRTVPPIIDFVNELFAEAMPEEVTKAQPKYERLNAGRDVDTDADHRPLVLGGEHPDPKVKAGALRLAEADDVAGLVASIMAAPHEWPVGDGHGGWRPAELRDATILLPTRTSLPFLRDALADREIPHRLATGTLVYDTQEVRDALAVLRSIDDPNDTLSLVAALRSPLYGCSDIDLYVYHQVRRKWSLNNTVPDELPTDHPVVAGLAHLQRLWRERWWLSPATMLERVLRERHGFLLGYGTDRPADVWRRLRFLLDQARTFEEANGGGLRSFLDWAALQSAEGSRVHEPMLPETDDDSLQIMTVHGSKGLEFPITILSGMTTTAQGKQNGVSVLWDDNGKPAIKLRSDLATAEHSARADLEEEMGAHEKLRLLYVAATRARDHLIVSGHHKATTKTDATYATRLSAFATRHPELCRDTPDAPSRSDADQQPARSVGSAGRTGSADALASRAQWLDDRRELLAPFDRPTAVSATAVARSVDASLHDSDGDDGGGLGSSADDQPTIVRKKGRAGSAIGSAVHATLEFIDVENPRDLGVLVARQCELHAIPEHADTVLALVRSALDSDAMQLARQHPSHREIFVGAPLGDVMIEGYVDLLIETPDGLVIVDWKTDSATSAREIDEKMAAYEMQGASYAVALQESTGLDVVDCRFVFCKASGALERSITDLPAAKQRVLDAVSAGLTL